MQGWILLHKKIWENPRFYKNYKATTIWLWLLTHCNDKGIVTCGRQQIAEDCGVSESCVYRTLKNFSKFYLNNDPILNIKPNNRFSTIHILKWSEMQRKVNTSMNNDRTTSEQPVNTNKEERIKKKNIDNTTTNVVTRQMSCPLTLLKENYPRGHLECVEYILSCEEERKFKFANKPKQFRFLHNLLRTGMSFEDIDNLVSKVDTKYGKNNWDFSTLTNWVDKGG